MNNKPPAILTVEEARAFVDAWAGKGAFRVRHLGTRMDLEDLLAQYSYSFRLQTQYEDRTVSREQTPFKGGPIDDRGISPSPWDIAVRKPTDFEERTEKTIIPHTERVDGCPTCGSDGLVRCGPCDGFGRVNCTTCHGQGIRDRARTAGELDEFGQPARAGEIVRETCPQCQGRGKVDCTHCQGRGKITCAPCQGQGRVKTFEQLTVQFRPVTLTDVLDSSDLPDHLVGQVSGEVLMHEQAPLLEQLPPAPAEAEQRARALVQQSQAVDGGKSRVLFQQLHVERVSVHEVVYRFRGSGVKRLWIYGKEKQVHAPGAPRPWGKVLGIVGGVIGAVVVLGLLVLVLAR